MFEWWCVTLDEDVVEVSESTIRWICEFFNIRCDLSYLCELCYSSCEDESDECLDKCNDVCASVVDH